MRIYTNKKEDIIQYWGNSTDIFKDIFGNIVKSANQKQRRKTAAIRRHKKHEKNMLESVTSTDTGSVVDECEEVETKRKDDCSEFLLC